MRVSELLGREVLSESGERLGRVRELRGELGEGRLLVIGFSAGGAGLLERLGIGTEGTGGAGQAKVRGHDVIPWARIVRLGSEVVVRDEPE